MDIGSQGIDVAAMQRRLAETIISPLGGDAIQRRKSLKRETPTTKDHV